MSVELREGLPGDREEWSRLALESRNVFLTPEWMLTWAERFAGGRRCVTAWSRDADGRARAVAPLFLSSARPLRTLRFLGHGPADELGPACAPGERDRAVRELGAALRASDLCDLFVGDQLAGDVDWAGAVGGRVVARIGSPLLRFEHSDWDALLAAKSRGFRGALRRQERDLLREAGTTIRLADDPDRLDADIDALVRLHRERFPLRSGFLDTGHEAFHRAFMRRAFERGWLRLWLLEVRGRPEAAWYGLRFAGCDSHYQSGRSEACPSGGGTVLLAHTIRNALEDGMREYRFLRGNEAYKYRWANADAGLQTVVAGPRLPGRIAAHVASLGVRPGRRHVVERSAGRAVRRLVLGL